MESIGGSELAVAGCFVKKKRRGVSSRRRVTPQLFTHSYILMSSPTPTISCSGSEEQHFKNGSNGFGFIRRRPRLHRDEECSPRKRPGMLRLRQSEKILSQDSEGKKKEDEMKKQRDELAHIRGLFEVSCSLPSGLSNSHSFRCCNLSTAAIFSEDIGLPQLFNSVPCRQVIPDPNCTNTYKYRDSKSKLPLCSLGCYKAIHEQAQPLIAVIVTMHLSDSLHPRQCDIRQPWKHQNLLVYSIELLEIVDCFLLSFIRRISFHCCIPWGMIAEESGEMGAVDSFPCYGIYGDESMVATGFGLSKQDPQQQQQNFKDYGFLDGVSFNAQSLLIPTCFDEMAELGQINYGVCEDIDGAKKGNQQPVFVFAWTAEQLRQRIQTIVGPGDEGCRACRASSSCCRENRIQRVVYYFSEALREKIERSSSKGLKWKPWDPGHCRKCCRGEKGSHDFAVRHGVHWTILMQALASRQHECRLELLKITAVSTEAKALVEGTGERLSSFAQSLGVPFAFKAVMNRIENTMTVLRVMNPCLMVVTEIEANHNSPIEVLFFFSAYFDCSVTCMKQNSNNREIIESVFFGEGIRIMIATEGDERKVRHVKFDVWRVFFVQYGMEEAELSMSSMYQIQGEIQGVARGAHNIAAHKHHSDRVMGAGHNSNVAPAAAPTALAAPPSQFQYHYHVAFLVPCPTSS
ncbi:Ubiquitin-conjugating enzyme 32 [Hibiscus syriacus]|uniref:Ubiquitin-conjugating enzyme 32 n=1 Tax=Hibiscus syriacus TaxID=106335 RepID=A0A6A2Z2Z1_HIBSY|nr:Ubiquitin-conjugating enzyme 32 [Hibiscus syriacus]